ncbi:MAG: hypothetical protein ACKOOG_09990, partial [Actinomycetota bacterium]
VAAVAVTPWAGVLVGALIALVAVRPRLRPFVMAIPAVILLGAGAYIVVQQWRYGYPPVFEWPTLFGRVRTPAWIAVMLLAGDAIATVTNDPGRGP